MYLKQPGSRLKMHGMAGACCAPCAHGAPCATGDAGGALTTLLLPVGMLLGAIWLAPRLLSSKR